MSPQCIDRSQTIRQAIATALFHGTPVDGLAAVKATSEWRRLLRWLDTSGLALLFFDHHREPGKMDRLPDWVQRSLAANLANNTERMQAISEQLYSLSGALVNRGVDFAVMKGVSLWPHSVPRLELRSQLDLDFLVSPGGLRSAQAVLEDHGFRLHARCGDTYEYKTVAEPPSSLKQLYSVHPCRCVELHVARSAICREVLNRSMLRRFGDQTIPVLAPCDLFLGQARHLYKHVCSGFFRVSHVVEFARHIRYRAADESFWRRVRTQAQDDSETLFQLAFCVRFIRRSLQTSLPAALSLWTEDTLPEFAALWIDRYTARLIAQDFPGSKLSLLLQHKLDAMSSPRTRGRFYRGLLPLRLPPPITLASNDESILSRARRLLRQARYVLFRLRFHVVSGACFLAEWPRWKRALWQRNKAVTLRLLRHDTASCSAHLL